MEEKMITRINEEIKFMVDEFNRTKHRNENTINRLYGMIDMLVLVTGKEYFCDENGIHER